MAFSSVRILGFVVLFTFIHCSVSEETVANDEATVNVKPTETNEKVVKEEVQPTTEETAKPVEEVVQPLETAKTVEEPVTTVEEPSKPVEETAKPVEEDAKTVEEAATQASEEVTKATEEVGKSPAAETEEESSGKVPSTPAVEEDVKTDVNGTDDDEISNEMEDAFARMMDDYASGKLNKSDMDQRFKEYRTKIQDEIHESFQAHKNEIWSNLGKKENDTVTWEEYLQLAYPPETLQAGEKLDDVTAFDKEKFATFDVDKDGKLTFEEFQGFFSAVMDSKMPDFSFEKMMEEFMGNDTADAFKDGPDDFTDDLEDEKDAKASDSKPAEDSKATVEETKTEAPSQPTEEKKDEVKTEAPSTPSEGTQEKREEL